MSYNLKNKAVALFAIAFSLALTGNVRAEEGNIEEQPPVLVEEQPAENIPDPAPLEADPLEADISAEMPEAEVPPVDDMTVPPAEEPQQPEEPWNPDEFQPAPDEFAPVEEAQPAPESFAPESPEPAFPDLSQNNTLSSGSDAGMPDISIDPDAPKSPIEKYGNAILSRVDNELFNQMSEIEKQTTLLNLELKREEIKNRIDALKAQRERAKQEELDREAAREKQARDEELKRQKALLQEQMKLREKEMELEKIRQAKVLSAYMNEMLVSNQQWVETNAKLSAQIKKLQDERAALVAENESRMQKINDRVAITGQNAEDARIAFERKVSNLNKQIEDLKQIVREKENAIQSMNEGKEDENPFATGEYIEEDAVDMSKEYAIMDITGKGENVVAKIVSQDGTTFTIRKGSVLKGGEVVVSITDKIITFENHGVRSYLYTGGTVMQYEPTQTFNDATKTPETAISVAPQTNEIRNVRGAGNKSTSSTLKSAVSQAVNAPTKASTTRSVTSSGGSSSSGSSRSSGGVASFSQGMMVK